MTFDLAHAGAAVHSENADLHLHGPLSIVHRFEVSEAGRVGRQGRLEAHVIDAINDRL